MLPLKIESKFLLMVLEDMFWKQGILQTRISSYCVLDIYIFEEGIQFSNCRVSIILFS